MTRRTGEAARELARAMRARDIDLVFGGSHLGLMGILADSLLQLGGEVIGVIPAYMIGREIAHMGLTQLIVVQTMHERKATMAALADAFMALPGGFGTLDELMEIVTWAQLELHAKPIGMLDVGGYFTGLFDFIEHMTRTGFVHVVGWGDKSDFEGIAVYLMSDASAYHTGDSFLIDGGFFIS